ncbi:Protein of unknown function [Dyella jiangningensis]|uniref:DUF2884 family protein n=1 Tax=Dyella sp. AtDHG13 TaxID=1938897 RepID=UPI000888B04C|nr:DUF2884 family protein [Dyella sp. AtDHG13]PXV59536.1 hypothetical protein BDW41_10366 [Dyella sp. AtDHG13]SDJ14216.1 Protein of unknown function [Dyella jiangningensis]
MRLRRLVAVLILPLASAALHAQDLATTCHATSSYDLTVTPDRLLFDRPQPLPRQVELRDGALRTDGTTVSVRPDDQDRLALFERDLRALVPRVKAVAANGVDMLVAAMHDETARLSLDPATRTQVDQRVASRAAELKQRLAASNSTHDWQGNLADQYANQLASDLMPLIANDLGQQAMNAAMTGDLQAAASLRDTAADLATQLRPRLERRMQALSPQVQALCPAVQRLAELQQGIRGAGGQPLNLLEVTQ